jgi:hypothetical protein
MTNNVNTNRPVFDAGKALATQDVKDTSARLTIFRAMRDADADATSLGKDGEHFADLRDGYLVAWQGQAFADAFAVANGKVELKGKLLNIQTGAKETVTMPRVKWQQALGSKVSKARDSYLAWVGVADSRNAEEPANGKTKEGATKAGQGAARPLNIRVTEDLGKLYKAVTKDKASEAPTLKADHKELLVAFQRCLDLVK